MPRHLRYDIDALNRAVDFARKAPDAIPLIGNNRLLFNIVPPDYINKTGFDACSAASAFIQIHFNIGAHVPSEPYQ
jgi:hypothetical protein